uniref:Uncharacterized protein n=1 Tax=Mycena chlorophos TaxID=658473 RepID=A0ABQ0LG91_MYCCL|nr:predicted protein [Mycena chlorophos]
MAETALRTKVKHLENAAGFSTWEVKLQDILTDNDYDEYVFGSKTTEPTITDPANADEVKTHSDWRCAQVKALAIIRTRVGDSPMAYIRSAKTGKEAWDKLQSIYMPKGAITIIHLRRRLYSLRCGEEEPIEEHLHTLSTLRTDLEKYGVTLSEPDFAIIILTSLPDSWDHWTGNFDLTQLKDSEDLISRVIQHAKQPSAKPENETSSTALAAFKASPALPTHTTALTPAPASTAAASGIAPMNAAPNRLASPSPKRKNSAISSTRRNIRASPADQRLI